MNWKGEMQPLIPIELEARRPWTEWSYPICGSSRQSRIFKIWIFLHWNDFIQLMKLILELQAIILQSFVAFVRFSVLKNDCWIFPQQEWYCGFTGILQTS